MVSSDDNCLLRLVNSPCIAWFCARPFRRFGLFVTCSLRSNPWSFCNGFAAHANSQFAKPLYNLIDIVS